MIYSGLLKVFRFIMDTLYNLVEIFSIRGKQNQSVTPRLKYFAEFSSSEGSLPRLLDFIKERFFREELNIFDQILEYNYIVPHEHTNSGHALDFIFCVI